ncbi:hypothetical protein FEK33_12465 [Nocardia asteroides NBRC 15531]|uniref:Uncharacterized protein n=1 Tax=Nocardia asteroides NBRC 15531 TaxID=1110697 RepID=U5EFU3_NOCAS|nr:hypothetical protein [Nocardia asteroides]TLF66838.1 hypothetical protein FEK33_12465 [Nocardia asteroides NBRC 15531]UGT51917.1 hypothetical protein LT345_15740 [Nocardia asteroides]SFN02411.1 hypothetical protein SAMN05444423_105396 [Nocardia asteroides]VEG35168.1 Uncharacterised protein [Nocardia asteroides]GAD85283.1 hypothetical protein NCAST_30_00530 [Nocardia asteroides NBRC 15531]
MITLTGVKRSAAILAMTGALAGIAAGPAAATEVHIWFGPFQTQLECEAELEDRIAIMDADPAQRGNIARLSACSHNSGTEKPSLGGKAPAKGPGYYFYFYAGS